MKKIIALIFATLLLVGCGNENEQEHLPEDLRDLNVRTFSDDKDGNWKKVVANKDFDMPENAIDYYEEYMEDDELHWLVSFATNTTTSISEGNGMLFVTIYEYVDKEEHYAKEIGKGMKLGQYNVYIDSGEIEDALE